MAAEQAQTMACYRHPRTETSVACSSCGRPICTDCMVFAPVGIKCPECAEQSAEVKKAAKRTRSTPAIGTAGIVTRALIGLNLAIFVMQISQGDFQGIGSDVFERGALYGPAVAAGEWWRLLTAGFLHFGLIHVGFNMVLLYQLGSMLEPALGRLRFAALYATALLAGSFGALLLQPDALTAGASGAVYGLMGAAFIGMRRRGIDPMQSGIGGLLAINLFLTFLIPGISIGGHLGGLVMGLVGGLVVRVVGERADVRRALLSVGLLAALTLALFAAAEPVADWKCTSAGQVTRSELAARARGIDLCT